jgi:hypothetical protein
MVPAAPLLATLPTLRQAYERHAKRTALAALALALLAGAGCGAGRKPSQAQFSARVQAICTAEARKLDYIRRRALARELPAQAPAVLRKEAAASRAATAQLETIGRPRGQGVAVGRWLTARTVAATIAIDLAEAPSGNERKAVAALAAELRRARGRVLALSGRFGRGACDAAL